MLASRYSEGKNLFFNAFYSHTPSSCMWPWLCPKLYKSAPKAPRTPYNFLFNICFPPWDHSIHKIEDLPVLYLRSPSRCHSAWHMTVHKRYLLKEETHVHWTELFCHFVTLKEMNGVASDYAGKHIAKVLCQSIREKWWAGHNFLFLVLSLND